MADEILQPGDVAIYIVDAGTAPSTIDASDDYSSELTSMSKDGGEATIDLINTMTAQFKDRQERSKYTISLDILPQYNPANGTSTKWDEFVYGTGLTSDGEAPDKDIYLVYNDSSNYLGFALRNTNATVKTDSLSTGGSAEASITFEATAIQKDGTPNFKVVTTDVTAFSWT